MRNDIGRIVKKANCEQVARTTSVSKRFDCNINDRESFRKAYVSAQDGLMNVIREYSKDNIVICTGGRSFKDMNGGIIGLDLMLMPRAKFDMTREEILEQSSKEMLAIPV